MFEPLEEELDNASKLFKARVGKFINKKKANKQYYRISKDKKFGLHELVMYKVPNPSDLLQNTFDGPARIIDLQERGATLRDLKTAEKFCVPFENLRKVSLTAKLLAK